MQFSKIGGQVALGGNLQKFYALIPNLPFFRLSLFQIKASATVTAMHQL